MVRAVNQVKFYFANKVFILASDKLLSYFGYFYETVCAPMIHHESVSSSIQASHISIETIMWISKVKAKCFTLICGDLENS